MPALGTKAGGYTIVTYWHGLDLQEWHKPPYHRKGDNYLPWKQQVRMFAAAEWEPPIALQGLRPGPGGHPLRNQHPGGFLCSCYAAGDPPKTSVDIELPCAFGCDYVRDVSRGIVIPAGGDMLPGAYVSIRLLRDFGCTLPVEVWHLGPDEMPARWRELLAGVNAIPIDANAVREKHPTHRWGGWQLKPFSIIMSRFAEVLLLDADNVPAKDPTFLFDSPQYQKTGCILWPDRVPITPECAMWELFDLPYREEASHEVGQVVIDKRRHWGALQLAMRCNADSDFWYNESPMADEGRRSHGDCLLYGFPIRAFGGDYYLMEHRCIEVPVGRKVEDLEALKTTSYLRAPDDLNAIIYQRDFNGNILFQHRTGGGGHRAQLTLKDRTLRQHFQHEAKCFAILDALAVELERGTDFWQRLVATEGKRMSPQRKVALHRLLDLAQERGAKRLVETGTLRSEGNFHSDGAMTYWLGRYAETFRARLDTVDISEAAIAECLRVTDSMARYVGCHLADARDYLSERTEPIDLLYLDSLDTDAASGPECAQVQNVREFRAAEPHLHAQSIVAIDDCKLDNVGKGAITIPYAVGRGWKVAHDDYVTILVRA